jgi:hypothetical protein
MGAVVSCISNLLRTIGNGIMAVISGIGGILTSIINAIVSFLGILVSFFTCGYCGGKRRGGAHSTGTRRTRRSRV